MKDSINLAIQHSENKKKMELPIYFVALFGVTFIAAVVLIVIQLVFRSQHSNLLNEEKDLVSQLQQQSEKRIKYLVVKDRLGTIQNVLSSRENANDRLNSVLQVLPEDLDIFRIDVQEDTMLIGIATSDLALLNSVLSEVMPAYGNKQGSGISTIELSDFNSSGVIGQYQASLTIQYIK